MIKDFETGLTAGILRMLVLYDPATGVFYARGGRKGSKAVGWIDTTTGYLKIVLPGYGKKAFLGHRLAWLYMTGCWPKNQIDHKNRKRTDNSWDNLREANNSYNQANRGLRPHNTSGVTGVTFQQGAWLAELSIDGERVWRKVFKTRNEAVEAREKAVKKYHAEFGVINQ